MERKVRSAGRHSRFVRVLRVALPVVVVVALGAYVVLTYYNPMGALASLPSVSGKLGVQGEAAPATAEGRLPARRRANARRSPARRG